MSGAQTSPFPNQNELMQANAQQLANYYAPERNRLFIEDAKQQIAGRETEMMGRASQGLLALGDEGKMAAAYPETVRYLQSQGFAKNAPLAFPGKAVLERMVSLGIPAEKQYEQAGVRSAATAFTNSLTGGTGTAPAAGGPAAPAGDGSGLPFAANNPLNIRFVGQPGAVNTNGFAAWKTPEEGQAATNTQFGLYADRGISTLSDLITRWAPPNENDTAGYIARVAKETGIDPGAKIDLRDPATSAKVQAAMALVEGNKNARYQVASAGGGTRSDVAPQLVAPGPGGSVAEQPVNQPLINRLSSIGGVEQPAQAPVAAPAPVAPAPAPAAPTPAPAAPAAVLPPLPPAPLPKIGNTGLTADQIKTLKGEAANARTLEQIRKLHADEQTYRQQNIVADKEYEQAVYTRNEKAQAAAIQSAQEKRAQDEAARKADEDARKRAEAAKPFQGTGDKAQLRNILLTEDPKSPVYRSAYAAYAKPETVNGVTTKENMGPYRLPQEDDGTPITTYGELEMTFGPGDLGKLRAAFEEGNSLKAALNDFAEVTRKASATDRALAVAGAAGELRSAWTNAALLAKGEALYKLGVLSGPDMTIIRGALADPTTVGGWFASQATVQKQIDRITRIVDTRLSEVRKNYGANISGLPTTTGAGGPAPPPTGTSAPPPPGFKVIVP